MDKYKSEKIRQEEKMLKLKEELQSIEQERLNGTKDLTIKEAIKGWDELIERL